MTGGSTFPVRHEFLHAEHIWLADFHQIKEITNDFHRELAKLLMAGYNGYKRAFNTEKHSPETVTTEENSGGYFFVKRKKGSCDRAKLERK